MGKPHVSCPESLKERAGCQCDQQIYISYAKTWYDHSFLPKKYMPRTVSSNSNCTLKRFSFETFRSQLEVKRKKKTLPWLWTIVSIYMRLVQLANHLFMAPTIIYHLFLSHLFLCRIKLIACHSEMEQTEQVITVILGNGWRFTKTFTLNTCGDGSCTTPFYVI